VDGDLANALLVTLGNEEHIIYRLTRVSSSKVLDLGMLSDLSMLPPQWGRCFSFGPLTLAAAIAAPLAVAAFSFTSSCSSLAFLYGKLFGGTVTEERGIPAIEGVLAPEIGAGALRSKAAPLVEESAAITRSGVWTRSEKKVREVDLFSVKIWLYLGNRSAVESIQEVCEGMAA